MKTRHLTRLLTVPTFLWCSLLIAQDTLTVQTLTFDSITTRRGWWVFPDSTHHFRKVLMVHTLKCDPQTTQDQFPCGEWDYLTYNIIHHHTGLLDSTALQHPLFRAGTLRPDSIALHPAPLYDRHQRYSRFRLIDTEVNETDHHIGQANAVDALTLSATGGGHHSQFLLRSAELEAAAVGRIDAIRFLATMGGDPLHRVIVRLRNRMPGDLTEFDSNEFTTVFDQGYQFQAGVNTLDLLTSFHWAGPGNDIVVDIGVEDPGIGGVPAVATLGAGSVPAGTVVHTVRDGSVRPDRGLIALDPAALATVDQEVTVMFRVWGDASLPIDNSILEAVNAAGERVLNIHLPWSDGNVYWDAGNEGGYDRINRAATTAETEGQWHHWAFVKNAITGNMRIYLDGTLWHSGTGHTRSMAGITAFHVGCAGNRTNAYPGALDDFNLFNVALDAATIQAWSNRAVNAAHPAFANLLFGLPFDEEATSFRPTNVAPGAAPAWYLGRMAHLQTPSLSSSRSALIGEVRPDIVLVEHEHISHLDSLLVADAVIHTSTAVELFQVVGNAVAPTDTLRGWEVRSERLYDPAGALIDSTLIAGTYLLNDTLDYFSTPFPEVRDMEIGRYITPYGINLSLGPNGFSWVFDVTDYQFLLHDSVEVSAGNQQELIDLRFLMIEGTPPREVITLQRPWGPMRSYSYGDLSTDAALAPVTVDLDPAATQWNLRTRLTGHGHNSNTGDYPHCCEWKDNTHYLHLDGQPVADWHIWQETECALNPVYPQGGTWPGSREGWCPGDLVKDHAFELTPFISGTQAVLDYSITPVPLDNPGMAGGNYVVNMDLFGYGPAAHALDAEIYLVKRPSNVGYYARQNPICDDPLVVLRNAGGTTLTSATFTFGVSGGVPETFTWTGSLAHMDTVEVRLPITTVGFWNGDAEHRFTVTVGSPNGLADPYPDNDRYTTTFELPVVYPENFVLHFRSNNRPAENSWKLFDRWGNVVLERSNFTANTIYLDTLALPAGCYTFQLLDTGNDGLSYWADPAAGSGQMRFKRLNGTTFKSFGGDFGRMIHWPFTIDSGVGVEDGLQPLTLQAFPNPGDGLFRVRSTGLEGLVEIEVSDAFGRSVHRAQVLVKAGAALELDLRDRASGIYLARIVSDHGQGTLRLVKD
ncbi:MAG TPA: LamG-like jellyroll fold domain-containing protein [Flavobacteriales bacterium]